jgi:hypothetical protein
MPRMTDNELAALIDAEMWSAAGSPNGQISQERARAWDYYMSKKLGNEVEGQSKVVTSDVADVVDSIMPNLLRLFTTSDNLVSFDAVGAEDEEQANQESDYVNHVFFKENDAFMVLYTWFFDALVQKNGYVKCWVEEIESVTNESYSGLTVDELLGLISDEELEPVEQSEYFDNETGIQMHDVRFRRVTTRKKYVVANVPPEEFRISSDATRLDPACARMVGQEREITRSDLLAMGFDRKIVESLPAHGRKNSSSEQIARYNKTDEMEIDPMDRSQDLILVREVYIKCDYEGNGRAELRQVFESNGNILSNEPADRQPFHCISPQPLPHKHFGRASAEKVMDVQEVTTTLVRQTLDNIYQTNNPSIAVWEQAIGDNTLDDLLTRRVGSIARFDRPPGESWSPMTVPFTAGATFPMMEYWDKVKRDRTGVHSDAEGLRPQDLKHIQQSVMGQTFDLSRMKIEAVARIFAETGIKSLFLHLHELILKHQKKADIVKLRNQWVQVDPSGWRDRFNVTVNIGLGIGSRESNQVHLNNIKEMQALIVQNGGMNLLVTPKNIYNTAAEYVRNANLRDPELYFTDPGDAQAPPPSSEQEQLAQQQAAIRERQQMLDQANLELKNKQIELKHQEEMLSLQLKLMQIQQDKDKNENDFAVQLERLQNDIAELRMKASGRI